MITDNAINRAWNRYNNKTDESHLGKSLALCRFYRPVYGSHFNIFFKWLHKM